MKEEFTRSGFQTLSEGFKIDLPQQKVFDEETGEETQKINFNAIDWQKLIVRLWVPALTLILYIIENDLGFKAAVILIIKDLINYGWTAGIDIRAPRARSRKTDGEQK